MSKHHLHPVLYLLASPFFCQEGTDTALLSIGEEDSRWVCWICPFLYKGLKKEAV